ncbi:MAG TPA: hypothetical protein VFF78_04975 [Anaerolineaceae bacterium]|nr:hypothetical protein [Anaerolineaceae bacterium]
MDFLNFLFSKPPFPAEKKSEINGLMDELIHIGAQADFLSERPGAGFNSQCRNIRAIAIGRKLNEIGGMVLMQWVFDRIRKKLAKANKSLPDHLLYAWDGVGEWRV